MDTELDNLSTLLDAGGVICLALLPKIPVFLVKVCVSANFFLVDKYRVEAENNFEQFVRCCFVRTILIVD